MRDVLNVPIPLDACRDDIDEECGYWWPNKWFCIACERPVRLTLDDFGRLHSETGKAIEWSDGWGLWQFHGVATTEQAIMRPETLTVADIKAETNAEQRRVLVERMGYERYTKEADLKILDRDFVDLTPGAGNPMPRCLVEDAFGDRYLFGTDGSTERCYMMPVPVISTTCRDAHQRICGLDESLCVAQS
jgi:hypothetical protein